MGYIHTILVCFFCDRQQEWDARRKTALLNLPYEINSDDGTEEGCTRHHNIFSAIAHLVEHADAPSDVHDQSLDCAMYMINLVSSDPRFRELEDCKKLLHALLNTQ